MVLSKIIKALFRSLALLVMVILFSCEEQPVFTNCEDCFTDEPFETSLIVKTDPDFRLPLASIVDINVYEGNLEDGILLGEYTTSSKKFEISVRLNKKYTLTATYIDDSDIKYTAVDSATPRVKFEKAVCEEPCYWVYDRVVNLRIKYN